MQLDKLYLAYMHERLQVNVTQNEHAFYLWKFIAEDEVYITDMFVSPESRRAGVAGKLFQQLLAELRAKGVTKLVGSTDISAAHPELGVHAMLSVGFKITSADSGQIWYSKEID